MVKQKASKKPIFNIVLIAIIVVLFISNIFFIVKYKSINQEDFITEQVLFKETKKDYNKNTKYYANIKYKKFNSLWKSNQLSTIAVVDNSSTTYNRFIELINKI